LKTFEETTNDLPIPYYITIFDDNKIIAASVCYLDKKKEDSRSIDNVLLGRFKDIKWIKKLSFLPAVMCGSKKGYGTHFLFSKELKENETNELQNQLFDITEDIAIKNNAAVYFSNVMNNELSLMQLLTKRGYYKTISLPLNYIDIKWSSFKEYKKYVSKEHPSMKKTIPRDINKNRKAGVVIKQLQNIDEHWQRLFELLEMNHQKYNSSLFHLKPNYFLKLKENFADDVIIFMALKDDNIIGVCVELKKDKEAALTYVGINHNISYGDLTYFNIAFYEPIKKANQYGIERIYGGNAFYAMKGRRGYKAANTYIFYKPNYGLLNYFIKIWFSIHYLWMARKFSYLKNFTD
jgi:predicted N-acyltransferase